MEFRFLYSHVNSVADHCSSLDKSYRHETSMLHLVQDLREKIDQHYRVRLILDNLPITTYDLEDAPESIRPGYQVPCLKAVFRSHALKLMCSQIRQCLVPSAKIKCVYYLNWQCSNLQHEVSHGFPRQLPRRSGFCSKLISDETFGVIELGPKIRGTSFCAGRV